jgi:hypothetical protein
MQLFFWLMLAFGVLQVLRSAGVVAGVWALPAQLICAGAAMLAAAVQVARDRRRARR